MTATRPKWLPADAAHEALVLWAVCFAALLITYLTVTPLAKLVVTVGFLYLPTLAMQARGEDYADYGFTFRTWRTDLKWFAIMSGLTFPLFVGGYLGFAMLLPRLPAEWVHLFTPYVAEPHFVPRLPDRFAEHRQSRYLAWRQRGTQYRRATREQTANQGPGIVRRH